MRVVAFVFLFLNGLFGYAYAQTGSITVRIENNKNSEGQIRIALYNSKESFPKVGKTFKEASVDPTPGGASYTFKNIPQGTYAIAVLHDENNNGKMDRNLLRSPKEPYGFSNNVSATFGAPDYDQASFYVEDGKEITLSIRLK